MSLGSFIYFVIFGFVIGLIARALLPGKQSMGLLWTTVLGVAGSLLGGLVTNALSHQSTHGTRPAGFIGSVIGAFILLWGYVAYSRRRTHHV